MKSKEHAVGEGLFIVTEREQMVKGANEHVGKN